MALIYSHCSLYSESTAAVLTHLMLKAPPTLSLCCPDGVLVQHKPHTNHTRKTLCFLCLAGERCLWKKKKNTMFSLHHIYILSSSLLSGLQVSLTSDPSKFCEHVGVCECIRYETMGGSGTFCLCCTRWYDQGVNVWLVLASDGIPTDRPQSVLWLMLHAKMASSVWNRKFQSDWLVYGVCQ